MSSVQPRRGRRPPPAPPGTRETQWDRAVSTKRQLSDEQEAQRLEGLRVLARIIARHALAHPNRYGAAEGEARKTPASDERGRKDGAA